MSITASTTLQAFFTSIKNTLAPVLHAGDTVAGNSIFVVDRLRLQNMAVPCLQLEPVTITSMGENSGMNIVHFEYRVHAIVKVELDFGKGSEQALLAEGSTTSGAAARGAFALAVEVVSALIGTKPSAGSEVQVFMRLENGGGADLEGLTTASATFRTMLRLTNDG